MTDSWDNLYPSTIGSVDSLSPWHGATTSGGEIDLREELRRMLYGASDEVSKGRIGLIRRMRRNSVGDLVYCPCRDIVTDESDKDYYCRTCWGMGYLWDEREVIYFRDDDTLRKTNEVYFYVQYDVEPTKEDYIIQITRTLEGVPSTPATREDTVYNIIEAEAFRSDAGRVEYWRCRTKVEKKWSLWYGAENRQHRPTS